MCIRDRGRPEASIADESPQVFPRAPSPAQNAVKGPSRQAGECLGASPNTSEELRTEAEKPLDRHTVDLIVAIDVMTTIATSLPAIALPAMPSPALVFYCLFLNVTVEAVRDIDTRRSRYEN